MDVDNSVNTNSGGVGVTSGGGAADVVFVIEGTAITGAYINDLKTNYIIPALEYFSQCMLDEREYLISEKNSSLYGIVLYKTAQAMPNNSVVTFGPYTTPQKVLNVIDKLELTGGKSESNANLAEGLAVALQCFDDLKELRSQDAKVQRHCILICNSAPYAMPVLECPQYENKTVEQLATIFHEKKINFSIISPRKIPILFKLFVKADGDVNIATKNYCKDVRHLVLLKGFNLKERPISPSSHQIGNANSAASPLTTVANNIENQNNSILASTQQNNPGQHPQHMNPQFQNNNTTTMQANYNSNVPQVNRWLFPSQSQRPFMPGPGANQQNNLQCQNPNSALISQLSTPPNQSVGNQMITAAQHQQQAALRMQMINQQQQPQLQQSQQQNHQQQPQHQQQQQQNQQITQIQQQSSPSQHTSPQQQQQSTSNTNETPGMRDREKIWSGVLEWIEKTKPDQTKVTRQVPCHVTANIKDGEPEIKAENWPSRLIMQLMPKQLVGNIGGQYLKDSKMVVFKPNSCDALDALSKVMNSGYAGCVHFNTQPTSPSCDIKVLILLYTAEKKTFLGFIPNNQTIFVDRLRKVIQQKQGQNQQQNAVTSMQQQQQQQNPHSAVIQNNHAAPPQAKPQAMDSGLQMPTEPSHFNAYPQMPMQMQDMNSAVQQQNDYKMNMMQQQRALGGLVQQQNMQPGTPIPPQRMIRPIMSNNPGLRHLLQQQQSAPANQFRPTMTSIQNSNMGGPHVTGRPNTYDDPNFDFI